jgi:pimeloyl-ACP methyl ester carboxylesterase
MLFGTLVAGLLLGQASYPIVDELPRKPVLGAQVSPSEGGVTLGAITPSLTASTGLKAGDVLTKLGNAATPDVPSLIAALNAHQPGQKVVATVTRDGKAEEIELTMVGKPTEKTDSYEVLYHSVATNGKRARIMVSRPLKASGKRPVIMLIQGLGPATVEQPLSSPGAYSQILKSFADEGWVTLRADKPGMGDSEGGPYENNDFETELDVYRQAVKKVKTYDFVDPDRIFIFGHSMGGAFGPIVAVEENLRGLAVYGTTGRTWDEYFLDNTRRQNKLAGMDDEANEENVRQLNRMTQGLFHQGKSYEQLAEEQPDLVPILNDYMGDKKNIFTNTPRFWAQLVSKNFAHYWRAYQGNTLALWAQNDFLCGRNDNEIIKEIVDAVHPGKAEFMALPGIDHAFKKTTSQKDSFDRWTQGGDFNPEIIETLHTWTKKVLAE